MKKIISCAIVFSFIFCSCANSDMPKNEQPGNVSMKEKAMRFNEEGLILFHKGKFDAALKKFNEAAKSDPDEAEYRNNAGNCNLKLNRLPDAKKDFETAAAMHPEHPLYHFNLGLTHMFMSEPGKAIECFEEALSQDEKFFPALSQLGLVYYHQKKYHDAESAWKRASAIKKDAEVENNLGMISLDRGDLGAAESQFNKALNIERRFVLAHYNLGVLYQKQNKLRDAEESYSAAIKLDPAHFTAYYNLALVQSAQGKKKDAIASLEKFIKCCPPSLEQPLNDARSKIKELKRSTLH